MNKAHGQDMISILVLKLCGDSICPETIVRFHFYLYLGKCLNACFKILCLIFLKEQSTSFKSVCQINFFQVTRKYKLLLIWGSKFAEYSLIFPKISILHGMMAWFLCCIIKWYLRWTDCFKTQVLQIQDILSGTKPKVILKGQCLA